MGRKSVPYVDESSLLRMRLREALEDENCRVSFNDDEMDDAADFGASPSAGASLPDGLTLEDLYRRNRNRARLTGLLRGHRSGHGASIIVLMSDPDAPEGDPYQRDAMGWIVRAQDRDALMEPALHLVH